MSQNPLTSFFKRWIRDARRRPVAATTKWVRLRAEHLEAREVPATLPAPAAAEPTPLNAGFAPAASYDPNNPNYVVTVSTFLNSVFGQYSFDGGASWNPFLIAGNGSTNPAAPSSLDIDPPTITGRYSNVHDADVAFGTDGTFYVTYVESNQAVTSGEIVAESFTFDPVLGPVQLYGPTKLYQWVNQDPAYNPTIGIDTNFQRDPATGALLPTDSMLGTSPDRRTKTVYVAWNTFATTPNDAALAPGFQPTTILAVASDDEGETYTSPVIVPQNGYYGVRATDPQIVFSPNDVNPNTNVGVSPGRLSFVWETASQPTTPITPGTAIRQNSSLPDGGDPAQEAASAADFSGPGGSFLLGISPPPAPPNIDATANLPNPVVAGAPNIYPTISPGSGNFTTTQTQSFSIFIANQAGAAVVQNGYGVVVYIYVPFGFNINTISGTDWTIVPGIQVPPDPDIPPVPYIGNGPSYNGNPGGPPQGGPFQTFTAVYTGNSSIQVIPGTPPQNITLPPITITGQFTPAAPYNFQITAMIDRANPYVNNANGIGNPGNNIDQVIYNVGSPPPDTPQTTAFPVEVDFASYPFIKPTDLVKNLTASVAINYQFMEDVDLLLVAPNGQSLQLLQNFNNENNTTNTPPRGGTTTGLPGVANLGAVGAANGARYADTTDGTGATFDDNAPRFINDTANVSPYIGRYKPEGFLGTSPFVAGGTAGSFAELVAGMTAAEATGTWTLLVTSHRGRGNNPVPPRVMANWNLHFSFNIQNSPAIRTNPGFTAATNAVGNDGFTDRVITTAGEQRTLFGPSAAGGGALDGNQTYPIAPNPGSKIPPPVSPTLGIGPSISVAYDTSVGGPYSGRMYLVYTAFIGGADYDIALWYSDDNGASWTGDPTTGGPIIVNDDTPLDNQTEGNRTQFMPQVTTDPVTGTVAVMWYDARFDASNVRAATMLATSIDGGKTFSRNTFVNSPKQARNALDPADYITLEPIPSIILGSGPYQFGNRQGLLAHDGRILTFWTGNAPYSDENGVARSNASGGSTFTYSTLATTAAGPRVVTGDSGVVGAQAVVTDGFGNPTTVTVNGRTVATYNDTFAPDGTRQLSGFRVRFDRPILASSFTAAAVQARYQDPLTGEYFTVAVQNPVPIFPVWAQNGGTTGAYIDVNGVPWYYPAGSTDAFYVPFATPQKAVGTYSYSVGPAFNAGTGTTSGPTDTIRTALPNWASTDTPLVIPPGALRAPTTTTSALTVSGIPAGTTLSSAAVTINIQMPQDVLGNGMQDYDLVVTLVAPDGTRVVLSDRSPRTPVGVFPPGKAPGFLLTTFDHNLENGIADSRPQDSVFVSNTAAPYWIPNAPFTGRFQPDSYTGAPTSGLGALVGKAAAGTWRLEVQNFNGQSGTVTGWSLALTDAAGEPVKKPALGNQMDQNMNGVAGEFDPAATGARADTFANPAPVDPRGVTVPFKQPFAPTTLPLIIPGPQVANVGVVVAPVTDRVAVTTSQPVKVVSTVPKVGTNSVFVVLNREVDPTSFTTAAVAGVFGPTGAAAVTSVAPAYASFAPDLVAGTLSVNVTFTDPTALLNPSKVVSLTGPAGNVDPNTLSVAATADPATYQIFFPSAVIAGGQYTFKFTPDLVVANPGMTRNTPTRVFEVRLASPVASAVNPRLSAGVTSYDVTFATPPGTFTPANITSVVGPNGPLAGPFTVTPVSPTVFRIGFPAVPTTGNYLFTFNFPFQTAVTSFQLPGDTSATLTFPTPPPRPLTATDLVSVVGPDGAVGGPFAVVRLSPTTYRVDFPAPLQTAGYYKFTFNDNPAVDASYTMNVGLTLRPADNLVLNGVVSAIDVTFDRLIDPSSVRVANVLRITGPTGDVPLANVTVAPVLSTRDAATGGVTTFQIGFPTQLVDGPYTIQFGPDAGQPNKALASIRSAVELPTLVANLSSGATTVPVTFSANSLPTTRLPSYPSSVIQSIVAPDGTAVPVPGGTTITQTNGATSNTYQINFPAGTITQSGQYVIRFTAASGLTVFGTGPQVDTNRNAGLARLRGIDPTATVTTKTYNTPLVPGVPIASGATVNYPINVPDAFVIQPGPNPNQQIQVLMNIAFPYDPDLDIDLVAPDGTTVVLFNGSGVQGLLNQANFSNTLFTDARVTATGVPVTPISSASPPYNPFAGAFNPQLPLSNTLTGKSSQGVWNLRVTNNGNRAGTIQNWAITLPGAVPGTGMGEAVADQFQAGFRVFTQDPSNVASRSIWTPVGPASQNAGANAGRVSAIQIDPSDPSGNTVYAAGESGGVWKTTNFMTTDPAGPHWLPLTDFGPTGGGPGAAALNPLFGTANALNIGSIALFPRNNDPTQTVILVGTGAGNAGTFGSGDGAGRGNPFTDIPGQGSPGVGFLLSQNGGRTWSVLDSTVNVDNLGNVLPVQDPARDHQFLLSSVNKVLIDPALGPNGQLIFYAAVSPSAQGGAAGAAGVWRSIDTGRTWRLMQAGPATDLFLAPGSAGTGTTNKNLQKLYAGFGGAAAGVYFTDSATSAVTMDRLTGGQQNSLFVDDDLGFTPVPINNTAGVFPGAVGTGKVLIAGPALSSSPLLNEFYQGWLYALVSNANGTLDGLYMTKDFGRNWVQVDISEWVVGGVRQGVATNNNTNPDFAPNGSTLLNNGLMNLSLAVDPSNPYVAYVGGSNYTFDTSGAVYSGVGLLRVDTTKLEDSQAVVAYNNSQPGLAGAGANGLSMFSPRPGANGSNAQGSVVVPPASAVRLGPENINTLISEVYGLNPTQVGNPLLPTVNTGWLNVFRDPFDPFRANATLHFTNVQSIQNRGFGAVVTPLPSGELGDNIRSMVTFRDPTTGQTRVVVGDDQGISSFLDTGVTSDGRTAGTREGDVYTTVAGFGPNPQFTRNGNLGIAQFYSGTAQPSQLAADIAGAMFYGMSMDNGFPTSAADVLQTGTANWLAAFGYQTATGYGSDVHTDQTGSGTAYQFRFPVTPPSFRVPGNDQSQNLAIPTDFFRVIQDSRNNPAGFSRTNGLLQAGDAPQLFTGQWNAFFGSNFAVNTVDPNGLLVSGNAASSAAAPGGAGTGRVFRSTNQGVDWFPIGLPGTAAAFGASGPTLDNTYAPALAFGAPTAADLQSTTGDLNHFVYVGTTGGRILASDTGGAPWFNLSGPAGGAFGDANSLDGSPVMQIIPNPRPDSTDVFVVTRQGVYYNANVFVTGSNPRRFDPASRWVNVTGNLFDLQNGVFGSATDTQFTLQFLTSLAVDWRYQIPVDPGNPNSATFPVLYVGGNSGVYRSLDALSAAGATWDYFPAGQTITDPTGTQAAVPDGGYLPNVMVTSLSLSLGNVDKSTGLPVQSGGPNLLYASTWGRGSFAIRLGDVLPQFNNELNDGRQSGPVVQSAVSLAPIGGPANTIRVTFTGPVDPSTIGTGTVRLVDPSGNPVRVIAVNQVPNRTGQGADQRNVYDIVFDQQTTTGNYTLTVGYNPNGGNVPTITDLGGNAMNQNGNRVNGEPGPSTAGDQYVTTIPLVVVAQPSGVVVTANGTGPFRVGQQVRFTVQVLDGAGNRTNGSGPIAVTLNPGDPGAAITTVPVTNGAGSFTVTFESTGTYTVTAAIGGTVNDSGSVSGVVVNPVGGGTNLNGSIAVGSGMGGSPTVQVLNAGGGVQGSVLPFPPGAYGQVDPFSVGFTGGLRVASGDVTGDGIPDLVVGNGPTISPHVLVFDGATNQVILDYQPFEASFLGGIYVAVGDVNRDGISEIVVTPDLSGGPRVVVLRGGTFTKMADFFGINDPNFRGGARAAVGDVTGDGYGEVVVAAGFGGGPRVSVYDGKALATQNGRLSHPVPDFFMFEDTLRNGIYVAVGDLDGDGRADIIGGGGPGGGPRVLALSGADLTSKPVTQAKVLANFFAGNIDNRGGVRVTAKDLDGDPLADLVVGDGDGAGSLVTAYRGLNIATNPSILFQIDAYPGLTSGVYVG